MVLGSGNGGTAPQRSFHIFHVVTVEDSLNLNGAVSCDCAPVFESPRGLLVRVVLGAIQRRTGRHCIVLSNAVQQAAHRGICNDDSNSIDWRAHCCRRSWTVLQRRRAGNGARRGQAFQQEAYAKHG